MKFFDIVLNDLNILANATIRVIPCKFFVTIRHKLYLITKNVNIAMSKSAFPKKNALTLKFQVGQALKTVFESLNGNIGISSNVRAYFSKFVGMCSNTIKMLHSPVSIGFARYRLLAMMDYDKVGFREVSEYDSSSIVGYSQISLDMMDRFAIEGAEPFMLSSFDNLSMYDVDFVTL